MLLNTWKYIFLIIVTILFFSCSKEATPPDISKEITSFTLKKSDGTPFDPEDIQVTYSEDSIKIQLPPFTDFSNLVPEFSFKGASVIPASGISQNFSVPVTYTVTGEDGSTKQYKVQADIPRPKNILFFGTSNNKFYALDAATGAVKWIYSGTGSFVYSSATYKNGVVYVGSIDNYVYAFNSANGKILWRQKLGDTGIESDAVIVDSTVYVGCNDDYLAALDARTGSIKWTYMTGGNISSSPTISNGIVYFGSSDGAMYALQAATGQFIWKYQTGAMINQSGVSFENGTLYVGSRDAYLYAIDALTGTLKWRYSTGQISLEQSSPTVVNNIVYIGGWYNVPAFTQKGSVYAVNAQTGNLVWEGLQNTAFSTSPFVQNNRLFIGGDGGIIFSLDPSNGSVLWQKTILHNSASPIEVNGIVYVGGGGTGFFYAFDAGNGSEIWKFAIPGALSTSSPLIINASGDPKYCGDSGALP